MGQPISASTNSGFKVRGAGEQALPPSFVRGAWRERLLRVSVLFEISTPSFQSRAVGVDHVLTISVRFPPLERFPEQGRGVGQTLLASFKLMP